MRDIYTIWEYTHTRLNDILCQGPFPLAPELVAAMTMFFSLSSVLVADFYIAIYFQAIHNDTPLMSGVHMLPITLGIVQFSMISGTLSKCFHWRFHPLTVADTKKFPFWATISLSLIHI